MPPSGASLPAAPAVAMAAQSRGRADTGQGCVLNTRTARRGDCFSEKLCGSGSLCSPLPHCVPPSPAQEALAQPPEVLTCVLVGAWGHAPSRPGQVHALVSPRAASQTAEATLSDLRGPWEHQPHPALDEGLRSPPLSHGACSVPSAGSRFQGAVSWSWGAIAPGGGPER